MHSSGTFYKKIYRNRTADLNRSLPFVSALNRFLCKSNSFTPIRNWWIYLFKIFSQNFPPYFMSMVTHLPKIRFDRSPPSLPVTQFSLNCWNSCLPLFLVLLESQQIVLSQEKVLIRRSWGEWRRYLSEKNCLFWKNWEFYPF